MRLDEMVRTSLTRLETVRVKTALNPLLWLVGLTTPLALLAASVIPDQAVRLALLAFPALPVIGTLAAYLLLLFRDPDRLQSEDYRLRHTALQIIRRKGGATEVIDLIKELPRFDRSDRETNKTREP